MLAPKWMPATHTTARSWASASAAGRGSWLWLNLLIACPLAPQYSLHWSGSAYFCVCVRVRKGTWKGVTCSTGVTCSSVDWLPWRMLQFLNHSSCYCFCGRFSIKSNRPGSLELPLRPCPWLVRMRRAGGYVLHFRTSLFRPERIRKILCDLFERTVSLCWPQYRKLNKQIESVDIPIYEYIFRG